MKQLTRVVPRSTECTGQLQEANSVSMAVLCERVTNISIPEGRLDQELRYYVHTMESQADKAARGGVVAA